MHCSQLWRPYLIKDIIALEKVEHRVTKYILIMTINQIIRLDLRNYSVMLYDIIYIYCVHPWESKKESLSHCIVIVLLLHRSESRPVTDLGLV